MKDDGVGAYIINRLEKEYLLPESVELIEGGTMGLELLHFLKMLNAS